MITDEQITDYRDIIKYDDNIYNRLGIDELLSLLAECIGDEQIIEVVDKYIDDFNKDFEECDKIIRAVKDIQRIIEGIGNGEEE